MTTRALERPTSVVWDEDCRKLTEKEAGANNLSFSTDDEFYKATREALPWADPDSDEAGGDLGRIQLLAATWVECLFRLAVWHPAGPPLSEIPHKTPSSS